MQDWVFKLGLCSNCRFWANIANSIFCIFRLWIGYDVRYYLCWWPGKIRSTRNYNWNYSWCWWNSKIDQGCWKISSYGNELNGCTNFRFVRPVLKPAHFKKRAFKILKQPHFNLRTWRIHEKQTKLWTGSLKVSYFRNILMVSSNLPKNKQHFCKDFYPSL